MELAPLEDIHLGILFSRKYADVIKKGKYTGWP